jgi:hypothetical protein
MFQYDSYFISSGNSARLYTPAIDLLAYGATNYEVEFMMHHDTGYSSSDDRVEVQVSNDAATWTTVGSVSRHDGTTGWAEHEIDISAYASESNLYVGFLGISQYGNSIYMDDVTVQAVSTPFVEYDETVYIDIDMGQIKYVWFPLWTPGDLKETTTIQYDMDVCTEQIPDGNAANDCSEDNIFYLLYGEYDVASLAIYPDLWYVIWENALPWWDIPGGKDVPPDPETPWNGTILIWNFQDGHSILDVDLDSIMINEVVQPHDAYLRTGGGIQIDFATADFLGTYSPIWDTQVCQYFVTGDFLSPKENGAESFSASGDVTIRGHASGDINLDTKTNIADVTALVGYLFGGTATPHPMCTGDLNNDALIDISDVTYIISYLFGGGPAPSKQSCDPVW